MINCPKDSKHIRTHPGIDQYTMQDVLRKWCLVDAFYDTVNLWQLAFMYSLLLSSPRRRCFQGDGRGVTYNFTSEYSTPSHLPFLPIPFTTGTRCIAQSIFFQLPPLFFSEYSSESCTADRLLARAKRYDNENARYLVLLIPMSGDRLCGRTEVAVSYSSR